MFRRLYPRLSDAADSSTVRIRDGCLNDVSLRCAADKVERIAGHQRQRPSGPRLKDRNIIGPHKCDLIHFVFICAPWRLKINHISRTDILQHAKKTVSVASYSNVSVASWRSSTCNVAYSS